VLAVVGASLAGLRSAEALRREGFDGRLVVIGDEDRLPYDRPPLSKQVLAGTWESEQVALRGADELDAEWMLGRRAAALDVASRTLTLDNGEQLACDGVVIATGATPRTLGDTRELEGVFTLRTLDDCLRLRAVLDKGPRVVVVGAGFIGSEVASTCRSRGLEVTVLEALPVALDRALGPIVGTVVSRLHATHGVRLRLGTSVTALEGSRSVEAVRLSDGSVVSADVVVIGVGVAPNTSWLESSGLGLRNGVECDARCQAAPGVVAAGDVARWRNNRFGVDMRVEHWSNAVEQAEAAANTLLRGASAPEFAPVPYFWSDQYGAKIQCLGQTAGADEVVFVEGSPDSPKWVASYGLAGRLIGVVLFNRPGRLVHYRRLIEDGAPVPPPDT